MHRLMLLMAALTPIAPQTHVPASTKTESVNSTPITITTPVFRDREPAVTLKPRRQNMKQGKPVSTMLNYIYDAYAVSNRHYHDRFRAPSFDMESDETSFEADMRATVVFDCRVSSLRDKMVSWLKVSEDENLELLTLDLDTHTSDKRYRVKLAGDNWQLELTDAKVRDSGIYCCHVSTHPPLLRRVKLLVHAPEIKMIKETFLETSETLSLKCVILHLHPGGVTPVLRWYRGNSTIPLDEIREGVLIETDLLTLSTHLQMARLKVEDAGNYTCALHVPIKMKTVARVHVLKGSSLAELQSGVKPTTSYMGLLLASILVILGTFWGIS